MAIAALLACGFASCNDWLDVQQNTEKKADHMFDNYDGFKGALAGCYSDLLDIRLDWWRYPPPPPRHAFPTYRRIFPAAYCHAVADHMLAVTPDSPAYAGRIFQQ